MTIRVMLADDHCMVREALRGHLDAQLDIEVIGEAGTGPDILTAIDLITPDVLVLDIGLPAINGIEVARQVTRKHPSVRILALSGFADRVYIEGMLKVGASGYVVKSAGADELIYAIRAVAVGHNFFSSEAAKVLGQRIKVYIKETSPEADGPAARTPQTPPEAKAEQTNNPGRPSSHIR